MANPVASFDSPPPAGGGRLKLAAGALLLAAPVAFWAFGGGDLLSLDRFMEARGAIQSWVGAHEFRAALIFVLVYAAAVTFSIPGATIGTLAAGLLFGPTLGAVLSAVAATLGATALFVLARGAFADALRRRAGPFLQRLQDGFADGAVSYMLFLRLTPAFPFWAVNIAAALIGAPFRTFVWTTLVGVFPASFAFASAGAGLDSVARQHAAALAACKAAGVAACPATLTLGAFVTRETLLALAALGALALIPIAARRLRGARGASQ